MLEHITIFPLFEIVIFLCVMFCPIIMFSICAVFLTNYIVHIDYLFFWSCVVCQFAVFFLMLFDVCYLLCALTIQSVRAATDVWHLSRRNSWCIEDNQVRYKADDAWSLAAYSVM